jgi:nucleoside-diphosphate kinase
VGGVVEIYGRTMKVIDYGDNFTQNLFQSTNEKTFAMIKPDGIAHLGNKILRALINFSGQIIKIIEDNNFKIGQIKMHQLNQDQVREFYQEHLNKSFYQDLEEYILSGPVVGLELVSAGAVLKWRGLLGKLLIARTHFC